jgi:hypothetical protein
MNKPSLAPAVGKMTIPPLLAYGGPGMAPISGQATLGFDLEDMARQGAETDR